MPAASPARNEVLNVRPVRVRSRNRLLPYHCKNRATTHRLGASISFFHVVKKKSLVAMFTPDRLSAVERQIIHPKRLSPDALDESANHLGCLVD